MSARYRVVVLTNGAANATVLPELGRVIALGLSNARRPNILCGGFPTRARWAYPHKGGIYVSLSDGDSTAFRLMEWQLASATEDSVTLAGKSESERAIQMQIEIKETTLRIHVTVSNPGRVQGASGGPLPRGVCLRGLS